MEFIGSLIGKSINYIILVCGIILLFAIIKNYFELLNHRVQVEEAMDRKNRKSIYNASTGEVEDTDVSEAVTPDTIREYEKKFNKVVLKYNSLAQIIPIFPLMGILGTVSGLIAQLQQSEDTINNLITSLQTALYSTFLGVIFAIVFKVLVAFLNTKVIEETEIMLEDYDKKVDNSVKLGNITAE